MRNGKSLWTMRRSTTFRRILFEHLRSPYVTLTNGKNSVKVSVAGYRWLAFWTKQNAPYLCIEPWHGHGDFEEVHVPFEEREGTIQLKETAASRLRTRSKSRNFNFGNNGSKR